MEKSPNDPLPAPAWHCKLATHPFLCPCIFSVFECRDTLCLSEDFAASTSSIRHELITHNGLSPKGALAKYDRRICTRAGALCLLLLLLFRRGAVMLHYTRKMRRKRFPANWGHTHAYPFLLDQGFSSCNATSH